MKKQNTASKFNIFYLFFIFWLVVLAHDYIQYKRHVEAIPYSRFLTDLQTGKISEVVINGDKIEGTFKTPDTRALKPQPAPAPPGPSSGAAGTAGVTKNQPAPTEFMTLRVDDPDLIQRLQNAHVRFSSVPTSSLWKDVLSWIIPAVLILWFFSFFMGRFRNIRADFLSVGKSKARVYVEKDLKTRFMDVAGVDEVKAELQEVVDFLKDPKGYSKLGGRMPKGILLVGPPGTGKTLLARAVAGEANVPFFSINGSEFVEMFVGIGAARVRDLFEQARAQAPCIIFVDELDALGKARGLNAINGSSNDEKEQTLNQLLAEMDGFDPSSGIIILAATNRPEILDPALLRSGRFDRQILVDKPDRRARGEILDVHLKKIVLAKDVNRDTLAYLTAGFSGADLANLVNEAALIATRRKAERVEMRDFTEAIERIQAGLERKSRILTPEEKRRVAYHEMGHAIVALSLGSGETVHKVSIVPRGMGALGYTFRRQTEDRYLMERSELENKIAMLLGGRAAEIRFFKDISTGAADDLDKATEIARAMVTRYGMSAALGSVTLEKDGNPYLGGGPVPHSLSYSEKTAVAIDNEIKRLIDIGLQKATECLNEYREFIEQCVTILMQKETLEEDEIKSLWEHARHGDQPGPAPVAHGAPGTGTAGYGQLLGATRVAPANKEKPV